MQIDQRLGSEAEGSPLPPSDTLEMCRVLNMCRETARGWEDVHLRESGGRGVVARESEREREAEKNRDQGIIERKGRTRGMQR